eukprot:s6451_g3.t1
MDALRADLGLGEISDMEYRQFTTFCRQRYGDRWAVGMNCREAESVDLLYHQFTASLAAGENDFGDVVVDLSKSLERGAYKTDGRMPTLTTSSHIFSFSEQRLMRPPELFASHGFNLTEVKFIPNKRSLYSSMTGNAMSVPVVGACILSVILVAGLRESHQYPKLHTRQVKAGSDTSPEGSSGTVAMQIFLQCPVRKVLGVELVCSRYRIAEAAVEKLAAGEPSVFRIVDHVPSERICLEEISTGRRLECRCADFFALGLDLVEQSDVIFFAVNIPCKLFPELCNRLARAKEGCRLFSYHRLESIWWTQERCPFYQLEVNVPETDTFSTSWSPQGFRFFVYRCDRLRQPSLAVDSRNEAFSEWQAQGPQSCESSTEPHACPHSLLLLEPPWVFRARTQLLAVMTTNAMPRRMKMVSGILAVLAAIGAFALFSAPSDGFVGGLQPRAKLCVAPDEMDESLVARGDQFEGRRWRGSSRYKRYAGFVYKRKPLKGIRLRLQDFGTKHSPWYRIHAVYGKQLGAQSGRFLEICGWWDPTKEVRRAAHGPSGQLSGLGGDHPKERRGPFGYGH